MTENILGWLIFVILSSLLGWLTWRAWKSHNKALKWAGSFLSGILTGILSLATILMLVGMVKYYTPQNIPVPDITVSMTEDNIKRGEHLAYTFCTSCHSQNGEFPMTGGVDLAADLSIPLGNFISANLTPAGHIKDYSDGEIFNVLRHGVNKEGQKLASMSIVRVRNMSDEDIKAIIAFLRSQPPATTEITPPPYKVNLLAMFLGGAGLLPSGPAPVTGLVVAPPKGTTIEYGEYIMSFQDCRECHGEDLKGGKEGQLAPIGWSLEVVKGWTLDQFIATLRTGVDPKGYELSANMPWKAIGRMDDVELEAMYLYLVSLD